MKKLGKILALVLAAAMVLSLVACGGNGGASMALVDYARTPAPVEETVVRGASDAPIPLQPLR